MRAAVCDSNGMSLAPLSLMLVDDNSDFLAAAQLYLSTYPGVEVKATANSGEEALNLSKQLSVDLVIMDLSMPGMGGLEATRRIKAIPRAPKVIVATLENAGPYEEAARIAGADGFVSKAEFSAQMIPLITALFPTHTA